MSVVTPDSVINICSVPMKMGNPNQLIFSTKAEQTTYFESATGLRTIEGCTYIRKDGVLRVPVNIEVIRRDNYVYYTNPHYGDRVFYCFIESMEYANDECTLIKLKTDYWQTYMFDIRYRACFVERETVGNDAIGANTYPEGLELGEYLINSTSHKQIGGNEGTTNGGMYTIFALSDRSMLTDNPAVTPALQNFYGGIYSGLYYIAFAPYSFDDIKTFLSYMAFNGKSEAIYAAFSAPTILLKNNLTERNYTPGGGGWSGGSLHYFEFNPQQSSIDINWAETGQTPVHQISINRPSTLDNYTPRNAKLLTFPYCYFNIDNNAGSVVTFHYEDFTTSSPTFEATGTLSVGCDIKCYPTNLKNASNMGGYALGIQCQKFPTCAWTTDLYTNWLTQNALNIQNTQLFAGLSVLSSAANSVETENPLGTAMSIGFNYVGTIANLEAEQYQHSLQPAQAQGNVTSSDLNVTANRSGFTFYQYTIRSEYARKIDDYFSMFGYKINRVKEPELFTRRYWNYVKTVGCLFEGRVPNEALDELTSMFDNGITFWHDAENFGKYNLNNTIV